SGGTNMRFDPFGNRVVLSNAGWVDPYGYAGRIWDAAILAYNNRAREYDPELGRFLQQDPLGQQDDVNVYDYVHNNPANATDPSGNELIFVDKANLKEATDFLGNLGIKVKAHALNSEYGTKLPGAADQNAFDLIP